MRKQKEKKNHIYIERERETKWKREKRNITLILGRIENKRAKELMYSA